MAKEQQVQYDVIEQALGILVGLEPLPPPLSNSAEYFQSRMDRVEGGSEYLVLLHHQERGLLEIFGNVTSKHTTLRMAIEALHMLSEQWREEDG
jgi:hypothetical protein